MLRVLVFLTFLFFTFYSYSNDNLLTIKQQLDRLQREVSDISKTIFSEEQKDISVDESSLVTNFSAIDIRIYDLEKDVKNLNANVEEYQFQLDDLSKKFDQFEKTLEVLSKNINNLQNAKINESNSSISDTEKLQINKEDKNSLGQLKISSNDATINELSENEALSEISNENNLSPEDQFQLAFDHIRNKKYEEAKSSLKNFIKKNESNQLSGSAHYWLGELFILEKEHRNAALIFAEGFQKYPESIKAPDMLFKLSQSLFEVNKKNEGCKTMEKFLIDYPKHKLSKKIKKQIVNYSCLSTEE